MMTYTEDELQHNNISDHDGGDPPPKKESDKEDYEFGSLSKNGRLASAKHKYLRSAIAIVLVG